MNEKNLIDLKKLSVLAITALLITGISGITTVAAAKHALAKLARRWTPLSQAIRERHC